MNWQLCLSGKQQNIYASHASYVTDEKLISNADAVECLFNTSHN